ncbi:hypothetical protein QM480_03780 [Flectobacillus sp. DC10W]|uniref:Lipoprotein n=1 Tax=Flectobacillus longus TaxID=2984207 RepID=A0ABT6YIK7_9BACT|nr:hypothetical protein [Flectobacillus longus]MDI9863430.1 hypothetical protein [Flectobacillus longus]
MKIKSLLLIMTYSSLSLLSACKKDIEDPLNGSSNVEVCGIKDPVNNLKWLSDKMKVYAVGDNADKLNGVVLFEYKGENVLEIQCSICSSTNIHQYKCDGTLYDFSNSNNFQDYVKNRKKIDVLYGTEIWKYSN